MKAAYGAHYRQRSYEATAPQYGVSATRKFTFDLKKSVDLERVTATGGKRPEGDMALADVAQVFSDPALQHQIPAQVYQLKSKAKADQVIVSPSYEGVKTDAYSTTDDAILPEITLASPGKWEGFSRYYLARYIGADGKKLARPVVTMFTIKGADFALQAPSAVHTSVTAGGKLRVSWTPVEGASSYRIILEKEVVQHLDYSGMALEQDTPDVVQKPGALRKQLAFDGGYQVVGKTTLDVDETALLDGTYATSEDVIAQNRAEVAGEGGVNLYGRDVGQFNTKRNGSIALSVVAFNGSKHSPLEFSTITSLMSRIQLKPAAYAQQLENAARTTRPARSPASGAASRVMTMADGRTMIIKGKGSAPAPYVYPKSSIDWATYKEPQPKTTMASVPYPVNGSSDFVKFLASNLMADNYYLDVTRYVNAPGAPDLDDALAEAAAQNPYVLYDNLDAEAVDHGGRKLVYISSFYEIKDRTTLRAQLWAKVQAVDAQIIRPGMDNTAKAHAINAWLMQHVAYDNAAFNAAIKGQKAGNWGISVATGYYDRYAYAQNATGALLKGKGVCASYALAFKALADRAGLPCIYVTGTVTSTGESHAWNKVDLGGRWLIVDSSWNDESGSATQYFGLTDNSALADRKQDQDFMVDKYIPQYAN